MERQKKIYECAKFAYTPQTFVKKSFECNEKKMTQTTLDKFMKKRGEISEQKS
jgi:hypothetical protein